MHRFFCALAAALLLISCAGARAEGGLPVRLHVVAESNDENAQALKLIVRDAALACAREITRGIHDETRAYAALCANAGKIRESATNAAREAGYQGRLNVRLGDFAFPAKLYGSVLLPEGTYRALRVEIGEAAGRNWWCVLYPSLCFFGSAREDGQIVFYSSLYAWFENLIHGGENCE